LSAPIRVTVLGSGTSHGVPMIGCTCATCTSTDPRDTRTRPSIYLDVSGGPKILVDTSTDLRQQALRHRLPRVDAILYTHSHADHVFGLDDVRRFNVMQRGPIACYGDARTIADLRRTFWYVFDGLDRVGGGIPLLELREIGAPVDIRGVTIQPVPVFHGPRPILGYRVGRFAYLTDCNRIPDESRPLLEGLDVLILDALRERPHPTHFTVDEALAEASRIGARRTLLTHIAHDLGHADTSARLPAGVELAYDGVTFEVN